MNLSGLRPTGSTDLVELTNVLRRQGAQRAALPASLPEPMLLSVARDLRSIEGADAAEQTSIAAPMMLVLSLLLGAPQRGDAKSSLSISEATLYASLRVYQWAVEREIVTRLTGVGGQLDEEELLQNLKDTAKH
ncbi:MAG: hypothetical protein Q7U67_14350 [Hydrogenophaga sp.]|nr:hypothetical protein [Hydrogenophaga sp.]